MLGCESEALDKTDWIFAVGIMWDKWVYKQFIKKLQWMLKKEKKNCPSV